jgi:hypothetical protein
LDPEVCVSKSGPCAVRHLAVIQFLWTMGRVPVFCPIFRKPGPSRCFHQQPGSERLPHDVYEKYTDELDETRDRISLREWSIGELNVPVYPEPRVYKLLVKNICNQAGNSADIELVVYGKYTLIEPFKEETYRCRELQN